MKRTFECGHSGKGKYCHACAAAEKQKAQRRLDLEEKRIAKRVATTDDPIDLSMVRHLLAVQREARDLLAKVSSGVHPFSLDGKFIKSSAGKLVSVPVGRSVSHEDYNGIAANRVAA